MAHQRSDHGVNPDLGTSADCWCNNSGRNPGTSCDPDSRHGCDKVPDYFGIGAEWSCSDSGMNPDLFCNSLGMNRNWWCDCLGMSSWWFWRSVEDRGAAAGR